MRSLRLTFNEEIVREIWEDSINEIRDDSKRRIEIRRTTTLVFVVLSLFFFSLTYFHSDWRLYGFIFGSLALLHIGWTYIPILHKDFIISKEKTKGDAFINKYKLINEVRYTYDETSIRYYEFDNLSEEFLKSDLDYVLKSDKWVYVFFKNPKRNIWIPKQLVDEDEYNDFLVYVNELIKTRANTVLKK